MSSEIPERYQITDDQLDKVWGNANFGGRDKREVVLETLLQLAGGFSTGYTAMCICQELKLAGKSVGKMPALTKLGKRVMYYWNKQNTRPNTTCEERKAALDRLFELAKDGLCSCDENYCVDQGKLEEIETLKAALEAQPGYVEVDAGELKAPSVYGKSMDEEMDLCLEHITNQGIKFMKVRDD